MAGRGREVLTLMCLRFFQLLKSCILTVKGLEKRGPVDEKENPATPHVNIFIHFLLSFPLCVCASVYILVDLRIYFFTCHVLINAVIFVSDVYVVFHHVIET